MTIINESILDPMQTVRCDALFNGNDKSEQPVILQSTKDFILSLLDRFKKECGVKFEYTQIFIIGSSLGFQYKDTSDVDVEVRISVPREKMKGKFHLIPKNILIPNTSHPINVFIIFDDDPEYDFDNAENAYDLLTDTWIKQGRLSNSDPIPYEHVAGISEFIMDGMTLELSRAERDMYELNKYLNIDPTKSALSESERKDAISRKIGDLIIDKDALRLAHSLIYRFEDQGYKGDNFTVSIKYEAQDKHYAMNVLIYKYIDQFGYYEKLDKMAKEIDSAIQKAKKDIAKVKADTPETMNQAEAQQEILDDIQSYTDTRNGQAAPTEQKEETAKQEEQEEQPVNDFSIEDVIDGYMNGQVTIDDIEESLQNGEISEEDYAEIMGQIEQLESNNQSDQSDKEQETIDFSVDDAVEGFLDGAITEEDIEESLQNGEITKAEYAEIMNKIEAAANQDIQEAYSNKELRDILLENGLEPTKRNVTLLKCHNYYIVDNPATLLEDLASRTERKINKMIIRKSGSINNGQAAVLGWLFSGPVGAYVAYDLNNAIKDENDEKVRNLYNIIDNDSKCNEIIDNIREELKKDDPDKAKLRQLKKELSLAINKCKKEYRSRYDRPSISLTEE